MNLKISRKYKRENERRHFKEMSVVNLSKVNAFQSCMTGKEQKISTFPRERIIKAGYRC